MYQVINSVNNKLIKQYCKLSQKKYRDLYQMALIEGDHLIKEAYLNNQVQVILSSDPSYFKEDTTNYLVNEAVLKKLSHHQSIPSVIGLIKINKQTINYSNHLIVLDNIQDPGNLGTIIRCAKAFNINDIIISDDCVDLYNYKVINASQGSLFKVNIIKTNLLYEIDNLKKANYQLIGSALNNAQPLTKDTIISSKSALFLGNEGQGLKEEIINMLDIIYKIEANGMESLNVSCAASILFYQLFS